MRSQKKFNEEGATPTHIHTQKDMRVCVEGNIAAGKSTALAFLAETVPVFLEPLDEWRPLLAKFYEDPTKWAFALSLRVLLSFYRIGKMSEHAIVERSPLSCRHVFAQQQFNDGSLGHDEWDVFKAYCTALSWKPDLIVYVATPADVCYQRLKERGRPEEANVDLTYLKKLDFQYETMLRYCGVPVIRVGGTKSPEHLARVIGTAFEHLLE